MNKTKQVHGFPDYTIDTDGVIRNKKGRVMHTKITNNSSTGYYATKLWLEGKPKYPTVHRLLMLTFVGEPPTDKHGEEVKHVHHED